MRQLLTSLRTLWRFKTYTLINVAGLVFSLACALIMVRYIHQERTVDHFCPELERTFLMTIHQNGSVHLSGAENRSNDPNYLDPLDDPCVERVCEFALNEARSIESDGYTYNANMIAADSLFLQMMPYPLVAGTDRLRTPDDAILTQRLAKRLFGTDNPIGRILKIDGIKQVTVVGVIGELVTKASITFDVMLHHSIAGGMWSMYSLNLVQLYRAEDAVALNRKHAEPRLIRGYGNMPISYQLAPLKDNYLHPVPTYTSMIESGNPNSLRILAFVVVMLVLVGVFNYINLHTVMMLRRAREFGLKKVFGANGWRIFAQLYAENFCLGAVVLFLIWWVVEITRGLMVQWFDIPVKTDLRFDLCLSALVLFGLPLVTTLFPFFRYNFTAPIRSLRSINVGGQSVVSRTVFISLQYVITVCLLVAAIYFNRQLNYVLNYDLNFRTKDIVECKLIERAINYSMPMEEVKEMIEKFRKDAELIRRRMNESPLFSSWVLGSSPFEEVNVNTYKCITEDGIEIPIVLRGTDREYLELFEYKLKEGHIWEEADIYQQYKVIVNEAMLRALHVTDFRDARIKLNRRLWYSTHSKDAGELPTYEVVGVLEDFKMGHLSQPDVPFVSYYSSGSYEYDNIYAAIVPGKRQEAIAYLQQLYHEVNGEGDFEYRFVEDLAADLYQDDQRSTRIYTAFACMAILVSCLGLFGLSLYDIEQRYREIALRKVHGAKPRDIFRLLLRKYCLVLGIAWTVASLLSYYAIHRYMQDYAHHAPISWWMFLLAGILLAAISLCTVSWQLRKAMKMNPAEVMKRE